MRSSTQALVLAFFFTALVCGCSSGLYPVEGKVVWKDGKPATELENGMVIFDLPEKKTGARASIKKDGTFRLKTDTADGAFPGEYKVMVVEGARKHLGGADPSLLAPGAIDSKYADPRTTTLTATVVAGPNKITLEVERTPKQ
jgi:hypothetical protein